MANYTSWRDLLEQSNVTTGGRVSPTAAASLREGELAAMYENSFTNEALQQESDALANQNAYWNGSLELQAAGLEQQAAQQQALLDFYYSQLDAENKFNDQQMAMADEQMAAQEQANMIQGGIGLLAAAPSAYKMGQWAGLWGGEAAQTGAIGGDMALSGAGDDGRLGRAKPRP